MENKLLFKQEYSDEALCDLDRDIYEMFGDPVWESVPEGDYGFKRGMFTVTVEWKDE